MIFKSARAFGLLVSVLAIGIPASMSQPTAVRDTLYSVRLTSAVHREFPAAKIIQAERDCDGVRQRVSILLHNCAAGDIAISVTSVDSFSVESLARRFIARLSPELGIDAAALVVRSISEVPLGRGRRALNLLFTQCVRGIPVYPAEISVRFSLDNSVWLTAHSPISEFTDDTLPNIIPDSAIAALEAYEREMAESATTQRPVLGFGIVGEVLYPNFYLVSDSSGRRIPFRERSLGHQLIVYPDCTSGSVVPRLAWHFAMNLGVDQSKIWYYRGIVDASTGEVLWADNLGGGCVAYPWKPISCEPRY